MNDAYQDAQGLINTRCVHPECDSVEEMLQHTQLFSGTQQALDTSRTQCLCPGIDAMRTG